MQATLTNTSTAVNGDLALDTGIPWIQKVQIMSDGQELETIDAYNRLHSMLQSVQGNPEQAGEFSLTQKEHFPGAVTPALAPAITTRLAVNPDGTGNTANFNTVTITDTNTAADVTAINGAAGGGGAVRNPLMYIVVYYMHIR